MGISLAVTSSIHGSEKTVFTYILAKRLSVFRSEYRLHEEYGQAYSFSGKDF